MSRNLGRPRREPSARRVRGCPALAQQVWGTDALPPGPGQGEASANDGGQLIDNCAEESPRGLPTSRDSILPAARGNPAYVLPVLQCTYLPQILWLHLYYTHRSVPFGGQIVIGPGYLILAVMASTAIMSHGYSLRMANNRACGSCVGFGKSNRSWVTVPASARRGSGRSTAVERSWRCSE